MSTSFFIRNILRKGLKLRHVPAQTLCLRGFPSHAHARPCNNAPLTKPLLLHHSPPRPPKPPLRLLQFHLSSPRNALHPFLVLALRYVAKAGAIVSGRLIRRWWNKLSPEEKEKVMEQIRSRKSKIACVGAVFVGGLWLYYLENIVENPITKRRRFMVLTQKQLKEIGEFEYMRQLNQFKTDIVPTSHSLHRRVVRVVNNLVLSNRDLREMRDTVWSVTVVDRPDLMNAFSLPQGQIFVFTGMLNLCTNDDQLAIVLAHEIAHTLLSHLSELLSKAFILDLILLVPTVVLWTVFSDMTAIFSEWVKSTLAELLITLPFARSLEREADFVGLRLAAKSCYDVREAPVFWRKMQLVTKTMPSDWMSTHPSSASREREMQQLVPDALFLREASNCPPLRRRP